MTQLTKSQKDKAARLTAIQAEIATLKAEEMELRKDLFSRVFPDPVEGSKNKADIENGYILQATHKINRKVEQDEAQKLMDGDNTRPLAEKIFKVTYALKLAAYKGLDDEDKKLAAAAVTEKAGTPVLEVKKPKH